MTVIDVAQRIQYLEAMGISIWERRVRGQESVSPAPAVGAFDPTGTASARSTPGEGSRPTSAELPPPCSGATPPCSFHLHGEAVAELDWDALAARVAGCTACKLHNTRTQTVFGVGSRSADWLIVGEAPGAEEDRKGEPFVGPAGKLLDAMLAAIGLNRDTVYIANILKCRPPNNRDPDLSEVAQCTPFLRRQVALLAPRVILAVGRIAAHFLLRTNEPLGRLRGRRFCFEDTEIPVVVTYHPAYLLRSPREKSKAWLDLLFAERVRQGRA